MDDFLNRNELLSPVVDELSRRDLLAVTRISRDWHHAFMPYLYRNVVLPLDCLRHREIYFPVRDAFIRNAPFIKSLSISNRSSISSASSHTASYSFLGLSLFPDLRFPGLRFPNLQAFELSPAIPNALHNAIMEFLSLQPELHHLALSIQGWRRWKGPPGSLRTAKVILQKPLGSIEDLPLEGAALTALELQSFDTPVHIPAYALERMPNLTKLKADRAVFTPGPSGDAHALPALTWLKLYDLHSVGYAPLLCRKLEVLIFLRGSHDQLSEFLASTKSLTSLEVVMGEPTRWSTLPIMLQPHASRLLHLSIDELYPKVKQPNVRDMGSYRATSWTWLAQQLSQLQTLCIRCQPVWMGITEVGLDLSHSAPGSFALRDLRDATLRTLRRLILRSSTGDHYVRTLFRSLPVLLEPELLRYKDSSEPWHSSRLLQEVWLDTTKYAIGLVGGRSAMCANLRLGTYANFCREFNQLGQEEFREYRVRMVEYSRNEDTSPHMDLSWAFGI